jgi:DNA mismatch repair protein MutS2
VKAHALWTPECGVEIGADWLEREIAPVADFGRRAREAERPFRRGDEADARDAIARVARAARDVPAETLASLGATIAGCPDPSPAVVRARAGAVLADADFFELSRFLDAVARVHLLATDPVFAHVGLPPRDDVLGEALAAGRTSTRTFYLGEGFDAGLEAARAAAVAFRARYDAERSRLVARIAAYAGVDHVRDGEFVLMRDRALGPLPPEIRVLREAPTYVLCEVALDDDARAALAAVDAADAEVAEHEERVRARLSEQVRASADTLDVAAHALGALDAFVARAAFAQRFEARVPEIIDAPSLAFVDARLLPLSLSLAEHAHRYIPLTLALDGAGVLTGPNMGGKTAALRTCGFLAACVALGVPVPAASARVPLFDEVAWIGIGAESDRESLLSSFGREVVQLRDFLARGAPRALALVDEFARTTSPREGRALLVALVETLRERAAVVLVATHLSRIAEDAGVAHYAVAGLRDMPTRSEGPLDLDEAIERIASVMDYRVSRADQESAARADALALADVLGLDAGLIARARAVL